MAVKMRLLGEKKAQAAVTDAMYFLIIATGLALFLFTFSISYGESLENRVQRQEFQQYTANALKTILYTSVPRNADNPNPNEKDFLLASVKEDYFDDRSFSDTNKLLRDNVHRVMLPLAPAYDYVFYFYVTDPLVANKYPYFLYWKSEWTPVSDPNDPRFVTVTHQGHTFYFCSPPDPSVVQKLLFVVSNEARTTGRAKLPVASGFTGCNDSCELEANLIVWPSTAIDDAVFTDLQCCNSDNPTSCPPLLLFPSE